MPNFDTRAHLDGTPVARPTFFEFPKDPTTFFLDQQFMWGDSILIVPVLDEVSHPLTLECMISGLYYKCFTIVVYDCNDSGQYYKTTITIVIDYPS